MLDRGVTDFTGAVHRGHLIASACIVDPECAGLLNDGLRAAAPDLRVDEDFTTTG